jgi:hypothetical protein
LYTVEYGLRGTFDAASSQLIDALHGKKRLAGIAIKQKV